MAKKKMPLQIWVYANAVTGEPVGGWLKSFDPDAEEGRGYYEITDDRNEALVFDDLVAAHALWGAQSTVRPLRPDGQPNKPMTAFTIEVRPVELGTGVPWGRQNKVKGHK